MSQEITSEVAQRVLAVVDAGLCRGLGSPTPGNMCVEAAVCYAMGLPHSDNPECVDLVLRELKIALNDAREWTSNEARAEGMRRLAVAQLGSNDALAQQPFTSRVIGLAQDTLRAEFFQQCCDEVRAHLQAYSYSLGCMVLNAMHQARRAPADRAEFYLGKAIGVLDAALALDDSVGPGTINMFIKCHKILETLQSVFVSLSKSIDAFRVVECRTAVSRAVEAVRVIARKAADADASSGEKILRDFAEGVVQILIRMEVPGVCWLPLTERASSVTTTPDTPST